MLNRKEEFWLFNIREDLISLNILYFKSFSIILLIVLLTLFTPYSLINYITMTLSILIYIILTSIKTKIYYSIQDLKKNDKDVSKILEHNFVKNQEKYNLKAILFNILFLLLCFELLFTLI